MPASGATTLTTTKPTTPVHAASTTSSTARNCSTAAAAAAVAAAHGITNLGAPISLHPFPDIIGNRIGWPIAGGTISSVGGELTAEQCKNIWAERPAGATSSGSESTMFKGSHAMLFILEFWEFWEFPHAMLNCWTLSVHFPYHRRHLCPACACPACHRLSMIVGRHSV